MDIARIERATGLIVNVEVADADWLAANADDPVDRFVPVDELPAPPIIGRPADRTPEEHE